mgnify:CR=1 FL=1
MMTARILPQRRFKICLFYDNRSHNNFFNRLKSQNFFPNKVGTYSTTCGHGGKIRRILFRLLIDSVMVFSSMTI